MGDDAEKALQEACFTKNGATMQRFPPNNRK